MDASRTETVSEILSTNVETAHGLNPPMSPQYVAFTTRLLAAVEALTDADVEAMLREPVDPQDLTLS